MFPEEGESLRYSSARKKMVDGQLIKRGIEDKNVLEVMGEIPRHIFIHKPLAGRAYEDHPIPIGEGQTISQPYMAAIMTEKLELTGKEKVLEIGTGSGYQTAILAKLSAKVYSIERIPRLAARAKEIITGTLGIKNVFCMESDGTFGLQQFAPYDRIIVTAGAPSFPGTLKKQLKDGGIAVIPVGEGRIQTLYVFRKSKGVISEERVCSCTFVPLIGKFGFKK